MLPFKRPLQASLFALAATLLTGCTLAFPLSAQLSAPTSINAQQARRYTVAAPPRDGASVLVILDDGSEVSGRWRSVLPGTDPRIETLDSVQSVPASRVVQIRGQAGPPYLGRAVVLGFVIDVALIARFILPSL